MDAGLTLHMWPGATGPRPGLYRLAVLIGAAILVAVILVLWVNSCRDSAKREAARLGLSGSARNLYDGRVELVAEGPIDRVDQFVAWARIGPPRATVTSVTVEEETPSGQHGFTVR